MKVLLVSTWDSKGGAAVASSRLWKTLKRHTSLEIEYLVFFKHDSTSGSIRFFEGWKHEILTWFYFVKERLFFWFYEKDSTVRYKFSPAKFGVNLYNHPLVKAADIVHLHWVNFGFLSLSGVRSLLERKKVVWTLHDMWFFTGGCHYNEGCRKFELTCLNCPYIKGNREKDLSTTVFEIKYELFTKFRSQLYITPPSKWMTSELKKSTIGKHLYHKTIPYPIDTEFFKPKNRKDILSKMGLEAKKKYLLFGAMNLEDQRKGFQYIRKIFNEGLIEDEVCLLLFGKINNESFLQNIPNVQLGFVRSHRILVDIYNLAHCFLLPSQMDNLPNTAIESIACGTPVIAFDVGGVSDIIEHKREGYLAQPFDIRDFAKGINYAIEEKNFERLSSQSREKAVTVFSEKHIAQLHENLYQSLTNNYPNSSPGNK
jgi:glycosyltransferase involved in cell wall biosynthesis